MSYQSYGEMTIEELRPIAEAGDFEAIFEIASRYTEGRRTGERGRESRPRRTRTWG